MPIVANCKVTAPKPTPLHTTGLLTGTLDKIKKMALLSHYHRPEEKLTRLGEKNVSTRKAQPCAVLRISFDCRVQQGA